MEEIGTKKEQLEALSQAINDFTKNNYSEDWRLGSMHHMLYGGSFDSNIMVIQAKCDRPEIYWGEREGLHHGFTMYSPSGNMFKRAAKKAKYDEENDFFYASLVPFYPIAGQMFNEKTVGEFAWILDSLVEIICPKYIILLGYDVFTYVVGEIDKVSFWNMTLNNKMLNMDDYLIVPLEDPSLIDNEDILKKKRFFGTLKLLNLHTRLI